MKIISIVLCLMLLFCGLSFAEGLVPEEIPGVENIEPRSLTDIQKSKVDLLNWKVRYWQQFKRSVELEYTGLCYKDKRYAQAVVKMNTLNKELQRILVGN